MKTWCFTLLFIAFNSWSLTVLKESERFGKRGEPVPKSISNTTKNGSGIDDLIKRLNSSDEQLKRLGDRILRPQRMPFMIGDDPVRLRMGQKITGVTVESALVVGQNQAELTISIEGESIVPEETKFLCVLSGEGERLKGICQYMVTPDKTYEINAILKDYLSGSDLIFPTEVFTDSLETFVKQTHQSITASLLEDAKDKNKTLMGTINRNNTKNKVIGGLIDSVSNLNDNNGADRVKSVTKLTLNSGTKISIQLKREIDL